MDPANDWPIHFFTIVLNGEPFIRYHIEQLKALPFRWHWHIVEGPAALHHDTSWSVAAGGTLPPEAAREGRSVDGTAEYLDALATANPGRITLYRTPGGRVWDGKREMVSAPLANIDEPCLLWEIDADELWTTAQFERMRELFLQNPERHSAAFYCWFFVGPTDGGLVINRHRRYPEFEWRRVWRFHPGMCWLAHEPPILALHTWKPGELVDIARLNRFDPAEMEAEGLVFQHFAYVLETQLAFKESYYGYRGIAEQWRRLQVEPEFPVPLKRFFDWPWVNPAAWVEPATACGLHPLAQKTTEGWIFPSLTSP
jgi:hypothetical protein